MQVSNLYLNVIYRDSLKSEGKYFALYIMKRHLGAMSVFNVVSWRPSIIRNIIAADHIQTIGYNSAHNIIISFNLLSSNTLIIHAKTYWSEKTLKNTVVLNNKEIYWELKSIPQCISCDHFSSIVTRLLWWNSCLRMSYDAKYIIWKHFQILWYSKELN